MFPVSVDPSWSHKLAVYVVVALQMTLPPGYISGVIQDELAAVDIIVYFRITSCMPV